MFTVAKVSEYRDGAEVEGLEPDTKALNYSKEPRFSIKRRERTRDSLADEMEVDLCHQVKNIIRKYQKKTFV